MALGIEPVAGNAMDGEGPLAFFQIEDLRKKLRVACKSRVRMVT